MQQVAQVTELVNGGGRIHIQGLIPGYVPLTSTIGTKSSKGTPSLASRRSGDRKQTSCSRLQGTTQSSFSDQDVSSPSPSWV